MDTVRPENAVPDEDPEVPITRLLIEARSGNEDANGEIYRHLYSHLHDLARGVFHSEGSTLQPTVLIHEAWMKLARHEGDYRDRQHFLATACLAMRQVMTDHVRGRDRHKRGGGRQRVTLSDAATDRSALQLDLVDLDQALSELERLNERHAKVVSMRVFGGMTIKETCEVLGVSHGTVEADWNLARAWLRRRLGS